VIGFLLEKLEGRREAIINDIQNCEVTLKRFHSLGLLHGDPNRYNFLVADHGVKLIDFECSQEDTTEAARATEMQSLQAELIDQSGRGTGFMFSG
jgi:tRNA A-37 threonylcarbamoyl transferase component Bud32